jgi:hypothetical protein
LLSPGFAKLSPRGRCQILTNLGNQLSTMGRFIEARSAWTRALAINPNFGIALGNRGYGLAQYARSLYDTSHKRVFFHFAYRDLKAALSPKARYGGYPLHDKAATVTTCGRICFNNQKINLSQSGLHRPDRRHQAN